MNGLSRIAKISTVFVLVLWMLGSGYLFYKVYDYKGRLWAYKMAVHPVYDGVVLPPSEHANIIWVIGDSRSAAWPKPSSLSNYDWVQLGVSGFTTGEVLTHLNGDLSKNTAPDWVVLQCGINDIQGCGYGQVNLSDAVLKVQNNINSIVALCEMRGVKIIVTTVIPKGSNSIRESFLWSSEMIHAVDHINQSIRNLEGKHVYVVDATPTLASDERTLPIYSKDGLHLNDSGYDVLSTHVTEVILKHP